ncbi:MAG: potassium transporter Kup [Motilibacteraceae bacterium]
MGAVQSHGEGVVPEEPSAQVDGAPAPAADLRPGARTAGGSGRAQAPRGASHHGPGAGLVLAALGVVFGDIGTSPLYSLQTVFSLDHGLVRPTTADVLGVVSLVFWSVTTVVSAKYVAVVMRADNDGEGGVMALIALIRKVLGRRVGTTGRVVLLGILGASLFYGDSLITPAISVLSAVEGLEVGAPGLSHLVVPIAVVILTALFAVQRFGTRRVGALFGPVMVVWFGVLGLAGLAQVVRQPAVLRGLSPTYAVAFAVQRPVIAFVALGAVVLCITGAEALYADMGHFGRTPIARAWFLFVLPALTLNYLGQSALILADPGARSNPFFLLLPEWARLPMVLLATAATVIASQAVISGAFSVTRQAMQLRLLPPLTVRQTSEETAGQVYLPAVNAALFCGVLVLVLSFRSSQRLATAYGIAVTGALLVDTVLLLLLAKHLWRWGPRRLTAAALVFGGLELLFLGGNVTKVAHGGWLPLLVALAILTLMTTWGRGRELVAARRAEIEGSLADLVALVHERRVPRVPGTAVFPHPTKETAPLALRANLEHNHVLHDHVVIVSAVAENVPHMSGPGQVEVDDLGFDDDGISHLTVRYGFSDNPDIPSALRAARRLHPDLVPFDPDQTSYFLSRGTIHRTERSGMARWRKALFAAMARNAVNPADVFGLPAERTVVMGTVVDL